MKCAYSLKKSIKIYEILFITPQEIFLKISTINIKEERNKKSIIKTMQLTNFDFPAQKKFSQGQLRTFQGMPSNIVCQICIVDIAKCLTSSYLCPLLSRLFQLPLPKTKQNVINTMILSNGRIYQVYQLSFFLALNQNLRNLTQFKQDGKEKQTTVIMFTIRSKNCLFKML